MDVALPTDHRYSDLAIAAAAEQADRKAVEQAGWASAGVNDPRNPASGETSRREAEQTTRRARNVHAPGTSVP
jgi:hypothetical protein